MGHARVHGRLGGLRRARTRRDAGPLIDTTLFRQRPFSLGLVACLVFFTGIPSFFMVLLLTLQEGLGYSAVKAGAVTLGFAAALAIGSARSAAVTKRLGTRVLVVGCALMIVGQLAVIGVMFWVGTGLAAGSCWCRWSSDNTRRAPRVRSKEAVNVQRVHALGRGVRVREP